MDYDLMIACACFSFCVGLVWVTCQTNKAWLPFWKYFFSAFGLIGFACFYLGACAWVGTDYSYTGGWFMFLCAFLMPIRFNKKATNVLHS